MQRRSETSYDFINVLAEIVPANAPVALLDFPWHSNPRDAAIWKGKTLALSTLGHRLVYTATNGNFDRNRLDRLHAIPFGLAYGRTVVVIDHGYGKLDSYIDTFLNEEPLLHRLSSFDQLPAVLKKLGCTQ